jgi:hypothetical protein
MRIVYTCPELALSVSLWSSGGKEWTERYRCDTSFSTLLFSRTTDKFPLTILPAHDRYYQDEPIMFAFLAKIGLLTAQATTVNVEEKNPLPSISEKSRTPKIVQARGTVYGLSELGKSVYRAN